MSRAPVDARDKARVGADTAGEISRLVLGIETSCDDTSVAVLERGRRLRSHLIAAQDVHRLYGGVVPELASRAHLELLPRLVERALEEAEVPPSVLTAVAVTHAPGLVGSLVVGLAFALVHGLIGGFPPLLVFGVGLAYLRSRTDSIYPCMLLHASFNAFGLIVGIAS